MTVKELTDYLIDIKGFQYEKTDEYDRAVLIKEGFKVENVATTLRVLIDERMLRVNWDYWPYKTVHTQRMLEDFDLEKFDFLVLNLTKKIKLSEMGKGKYSQALIGRANDKRRDNTPEDVAWKDGYVEGASTVLEELDVLVKQTDMSSLPEAIAQYINPIVKYINRFKSSKDDA